VNKNLALKTGKRKTAIARVFLRQGDGKITVNGKNVDDYFPGELFTIMVKKPLEVTDNLTKYNIKINVKGGGYSGQAGACQHGIARVLASYDTSNRAALKANGFLTRDSRMVERKKYGRRGARRRFQFSKR
jgi:small subunit ribosomal protein S9